MLKLHEEKEIINVVCDQIGSPTSTVELSKICWEIVRKKNIKKLPFILHWSQSGVASWYDLAIYIGRIGKEIGLIQKQAKINPIRSTSYKTAAQRPSYSVLNTFNTQEYLQFQPSYWQDTLKQILYDLKDNYSYNN